MRGAEGAACNVNSIAGPLAACGMACGGSILSARKRAMEPWSQRARLGAWRLRWIACGRARHSLSSVGVVVVLVHFVCRNAHLSSCHVSIVRSLGESRVRVRVSHSGDVRDCRVGRFLLVSRVQSRWCCSAYTVNRVRAVHRIARSQGHPALGAD